MGFKFGARSEANLVGVHPDLVAVARRAIEISRVDFMVVDGLRTQEEQDKFLAAGASQIRNSRHLTGHAIDIAAWVNGAVSWEYGLFVKIAEAFKTAALELKVPIVWGGDWRKFKDAGHFELNRGKYP